MMRGVFTPAVLATCAFSLCAALPTTGAAQSIAPCDWRASAQAIVEPWDMFSRTYANGDVRVALLDTIEPGAGALHLLVLSPPRDELGSRQCNVVSYDGSIGFAGMLFEDHIADYDPLRGLTLSFDAQIYRDDLADFAPAILDVTINQSTGVIEAVVFQ
ncbi:hypothetical protein [Shimia ponticola]|uniref:hypothetical protein n=1 Tax=Shimia ponticola TaxID=2582893 RepID=UPI002104707C|nr:hypothetical protein [Shimia ponticola]